MDVHAAIAILKKAGLQKRPQRIAVVQYMMSTKSHPSADEVLEHVRKTHPTVSRATVYNVLHTLARHGIIRQCAIKPGAALYDGRTDPHHHFVDEDTGEIYDIPWDQVRIESLPEFPGYEVTHYSAVLRGRKRRS